MPYYLQSLSFYTTMETHNYVTLIQHNIHQPTCKQTFAKNCVLFNMPITIETSPTCILDKVYTDSLQDFSGYIKAYILQYYWENGILEDCYVYNTQT